MARVEYEGFATEQPQAGPPEDYQHLDVSPRAFGSAAAQGAEQLGQAGLDLAKFYSTTAAQDSTNNTLQQVTNVLYGDPNKQVMGPDGTPMPDTGYFGLRGADAMSKRKEISDHIDEIIRSNSENLTPAAQKEYENETRRYRAQWGHEMGAHADEQQRNWMSDTNNTSAQIALNNLARSPLDSKVVQSVTESVRRSYVRNAQLKGEDPQGAQLKADQAVAVMRIEALLPTNPDLAGNVLNENRGLLASLPNYDSLAERVKNRTTEATLGPSADSFLSRYTPSGNASPNNIGNVKTADAARSGALDFQQPKTPEDGVALTVETLRRGYQGMTLEQIGKKWEGTTPEHVQNWIHNVSQASGIAHDAVPNLNDPKQLHALVHGIGVAEKSTAQRAAFTDDVIDSGIKKAGLAATPATPQNIADYYRSNYAQLVEKADSEAERIRPGDAVFADRFRGRVERNMNDFIRQQELSYKANADTVFQAFNGSMSNGHQPTSVEEMRAISPQVAQAWDNFQADNPQGALAVETRLLNANSRGKAAGYGTEFYKMLRQVLAPSDDPSYIHDPAKLMQYVQPGENGPLSNTGFSQIQKVLSIRGTPEGEAFTTSFRNFLDAAHGQISGSDPRTGAIDHKGDQLFNKFLPDAFAKMQAGLKAGKTPSQMFNPQSPDYIGDSIYNYTRKPADRIKDMMEDKQSAAMYGPKPLSAAQSSLVDRAVKSKALSPEKGAELRSLMEAVQNHRMTRQQAIAQAVAHGLIASPPPPVPLPSGH